MAVKQLLVKKRDVKDSLEAIRLAEYIPAVVYGPDQEPINLMVEARVFEKLYEESGSSTVVELDIEGQKLEVLIHDLQRDPVKDNLVHIDFYKLQSGHKLTTNIPVIFIGKPDTKAGALFIEKDTIKVKSLPKDLVENVEVDLGKITDENNHISVSDVKLSEAIEVLDEGHLILAVVKVPRQNKEDIAADAADAAAAAPVDGEVPVEGEVKEEDKKEA